MNCTYHVHPYSCNILFAFSRVFHNRHRREARNSKIFDFTSPRPPSRPAPRKFEKLSESLAIILHVFWTYFSITYLTILDIWEKIRNREIAYSRNDYIRSPGRFATQPPGQPGCPYSPFRGSFNVHLCCDK